MSALKHAALSIMGESGWIFVLCVVIIGGLLTTFGLCIMKFADDIEKENGR